MSFVGAVISRFPRELPFEVDASWLVDICSGAPFAGAYHSGCHPWYIFRPLLYLSCEELTLLFNGPYVLSVLFGVGPFVDET